MNHDKDNWSIPTGLSRNARKLAVALAKLAKKFDWNSGGQKVFYSPSEWKDLGETYGLGGEQECSLVILHEGGDHAPFFSLDHSSYAGSYDRYEEQIKFLKSHGFWIEGLYTWASAIYES